jgi:mercuric ion transport protein
MLSKFNPLKTGIIGAVIAVLCCSTPILVILLGVVGLSALVGYLDYVLLPVLVFFIGLTFYGLWKQKSAPVSGATCCNLPVQKQTEATE